MSDSERLPEPMVPPEVDLRDFEFMPLYVRRLRDSRFVAIRTAEEVLAGILLWSSSWHQVPAGSLPDDEVELSNLAGYGGHRGLALFRKVKDGALHGFVRCSDGRLYHRVVAEAAISAWAGKVKEAWRRDGDRWRKRHPRTQFPDVETWNSERLSAGTGLTFQWNGPVIPLEPRQTSAGTTPPAAGIPPVLPSKGQGEGQSKGQGQGQGESLNPSARIVPAQESGTRFGHVAARLRAARVNITPANPFLVAWVQELKVTDAQLDEAIARAHLNKPDPEKIPPKYLDPIVREVVEGPKPRANGEGRPIDREWWASEKATVAKGEALGVIARPGEELPAYRQRIREAIARQASA